MDRHWTEDAACRGKPTEWWCPPDGTSSYYRSGKGSRWYLRPEAEKAVAMCNGCPVLESCRRDHMGERYGIWGGLTERQRERIRSQRQASIQALPLEDRMAVGRRLAERRSRSIPMSWAAIGREFALPLTYCLELHAEFQKYERKGKARPAEGPAVHLSDQQPAEWPRGAPEFGNLWIWYKGAVRGASYLAQSPDGWVRVRSNYRNVPVHVWLPMSQVKFTANVPPVIEPRPLTKAQQRAKERERARARAAESSVA